MSLLGYTVTSDNHSKQRPYQPKKPLQLSPESIEQFRAVQNAIATCPKLFFINNHSEVFLHTDASDGGIGAYLFQMVDGARHPIQFVSKALSKSQRKWSTPEKECYAIFHSLHKLDYLLHDIHFVLRTDHRNLTFLNQNGSPKVLRWKLDIQPYDFEIEYLPGPDNPEADSFSRMDYNNAMHGPWPVTGRTSLARARRSAVTARQTHYTRLATFNTTMPDNQNIIAPLFAATAIKLETKRTEPTFTSLNALHHHPHRVIPYHGQLQSLPLWTYKTIQDVHNAVEGHHGINRTTRKLRKKQISWPTMNADIAQFIRQCPQCQLMSQLKAVIHTAPFTTSTYAPFERIALDTIGPFKPDIKGNTHILVIIDCFSRYVELYPIHSLDAQTAADHLIHFVCHYDTPMEILHDKGTQFENELWTILKAYLATDGLDMMPYSKEENSLVERANKEVVRHVSHLLTATHVRKDLTLYLPLVQRIINSTEHDAVGTTPVSLIFGNTVKLDRHTVDQPYFREPPQNVNYHKYMDNLISCQNKLILKTQGYLQKRDSHKLTTRQPQTHTEFLTNSYVLVQPHTTNETPLKGEPRWLGPFRVVNHIGSRYTVQNLITLKTEDFHISKLKEFLYDPARTDPNQIARMRNDYFEVDSILQHTGDTKSVKTLQFLVRWKGLGSASDSWEPWSSLYRTRALHVYLYTHKLRKLIPNQFRHDYPKHAGQKRKRSDNE